MSRVLHGIRSNRRKTCRLDAFPSDYRGRIGTKTAEKLERAGVNTIAAFVAMDPQATRDMLTVVGARIQQELRGVSCLPLSEWSATRKGVASTRSFGRPITEWREMREAVAAQASRAAEKLRAEGLQTCRLAVFLQTNPHAPGEPWHSGQRAARIEPTNDSRGLIREAVRMLRPLWRDGFRYFKAGVMLDDLVPQARQPTMMFRHEIRCVRGKSWRPWTP